MRCRLEIIPVEAMSHEDAHTWLLGRQRSRLSMREHVLVRMPRSEKVTEELFGDLQRCCVPNMSSDDEWWFTPAIPIAGVRMKWHPLLSDYLFAFCLSTILRYQP